MSGALPFLTHGERALWYLHRLAPESSAYHIAAAARVASVLEPEALRQALVQLTARHPALRTTFEVRDGEPRRRVSPEPVVDFAVLEDVGALADEAHRPFDLERGPLLRMRLFRAPGGDVLLLVLHHIVADFWSLTVLVRDLGRLLGGEPLEPLGATYEEHVLAERKRLERDGDRLRDGWRERLAGVPLALDLPADRPRPSVPSHRGAVSSLRLPISLPARGATPFQVLTAAFQVLLHRHTGQDRFVIGTPTAGRSRAALASVAGYFVNPVPLRADLSGRPTFAELVGRARQEVRGALARAGYPFPLLAEAAQPERDPSRSPVFQAMLVFERPPAGAPADLSAFALGEPGGRLDLGGLVLDSMPIEERASQLDLALRVGEVDGALVASLQYATDLFDATTASRLLERFGVLLAAATAGTAGMAQPDRPVAELPVLSASEEAELRAWRGVDPWPAPEIGLHQLVAAQAERTPDAVAVIGEAESVTYRELMDRAGRLARHLAALGAGPERIVGVRMERKPDLVASLLGVLQSGAAYLPLDPAYPEERLAFMLEDSGAEIVVTGDLPGTAGAPPAVFSSDNLAYLIYTSGSTGRPKAVAVEHRSAVARMLWAREAFSDAEMAAVLASTSVCFDLSVFEIFAPLSRGGTVVLARSALELPPVPVTLVNTVPSAMMEIADALPPSVRTVCLAGEPLPAALAERLLRRGVRLLNLYGPSEDTTYSTGAEIVPGEEPPIGRPLPGTRAHVVDAELRPVPPGVPGELLLGGAGLSRGYLGRPDLTAERFVPDPSGPPGARLYRTGDRVRYRQDGALLFLGRLDRQVKIRGFRVEPGEIEAALGRHPAVRECAVLVRDGALVAYVSGAATPEELRSFLAARLPAHLVPAGLVVLDALPHTPNGKIDRQALARIAPVLETGPMAPRTGVEEALAGLWREVLGVAAGPRDDFFALGGHSLLAARLLSRVREALGTAPTLAAFLADPTLDGLARAFRSGEAVQGPAPRTRTGLLPLSFAQQRLWFLHRLEPASAAYNMPLAVRLAGEVDVPALAAALQEIVRRHEVLRTRFVEVGGEPGQVVLDDPEILLRVVEEAVLEDEAARPFDLATEPPVRALLMRAKTAGGAPAVPGWILLVTFHHIASDGWSLGVLARELRELYEGRALPPLPLQYGDFAVWQRERRLSADLPAWWREQLAGVPPLDLPTDRPRSAEPSSRGDQVALTVPLAPAAAFARAHGCTLYMALLAAFEALLGRWADQTGFAVGTPVAGRGWRELEGLIGCFVGTLAMRTDLSGDPTAAELARRVRQTALAAYAHEDVPFERLVEELAPERDLGRSPVFQAMLALQNAPLPELSLGGAALEPLEVRTGAAKFELTLSLREVGEALTGTLEYRADLFDRATAQRLAGGFATLLAGLDPERRWSDLPLMSSAELAQVVGEETADVPAGFLHEGFEAQAQRTPEAVAVTGKRGSMTYGELADRSARLAERLCGLGVGPETVVGVYTRRTPEMVVAVLGVLRAGGAYVPLDPAQPAERLAYILADSGARVVVVDGELEDGLKAMAPEVVAVRPSLPSPRGPGVRLGEGPGVRALSHLIYTSGSTGRPKGVAIEHRSGAALVRWALDTFAPEELEAVLAATSLGFDLSVFELFAPLSCGGRIALAESVLDLPWPAGITLVNTVPSAMAELVRLGPLPASVRTVCLAGEALPRPLVEQIPVRVWNLYGPTEDTTYSTAEPVIRNEAGAPPIGRPLPGTRARVLDRSLRPVPFGVPGELCLSGAGLARGYAGRPDLTAERFVPDPFAEGERLYRTGDRARLRPDGRLDYLGRLDDQIKVRGVRIEPGEIEAALAAHPAVEQAAVTVREDRPGDRRLAAYVVLCQEAPDLRDHLRRLLPEAMMPAWIVPVESFRRTASGKVDRRALPAPAGEEPETGYVPPATPVEEELARIWAEVLGRERVGVHDDFFALGGHSLLAVRLVARIRDVFAFEVPLQELFRTPTVSRLAQLVEERREPPEPMAAPVLARADRDRFRRSRTA
jgi:amino acid adenylation domain-containing protein